MNDDLIKRSDVLEVLESYFKPPIALPDQLFAIIKGKINSIPAADNAGEWMLRQLSRMCYAHPSCKNCPFDEIDTIRKECPERVLDHISEAAEIIRHWAEEHPEKPVRTRQDVLLEVIPGAKKGGSILDICPYIIEKIFECNGGDCYECRKKYWLSPAPAEEDHEE